MTRTQTKRSRVAEVLSLLALALTATAPLAANGAPGPGPQQLLKQLSLEDLGNIEVTTVSKEPSAVRRTPAAVHVITQEDIRRSGATSLPEVLRLAPGLDVARIDSTHWSVGVRGFGDQFSKSVLLLIDGRSVYTPLFAGVFWAMQDTALDDIDRIEIIRGPGGTIWGANAVNGVINIVTKSAADTTKAQASFTTGNIDEVIGGLRYGGQRGDVHYRVYGKGVRRATQDHLDGQSFDTWRMGTVGGRADWSRDGDAITIQGDGYGGRVGQSVALASFSPPSQVVHYEPLEVSGGNVMASWRRTMGDDRHVLVRAYYDRTHLLGPQVGETRNTFDVDLTSGVPIGSRQKLVWGAGARVSPSMVTQTIETLDIVPHDHTSSIFSAFAQDDLSLVPNRVNVTVGAKVEHNEYTGVEVQPSVRLLWTPSDRHTVWSSVTRAVRTPSRLERDFALNFYLGSNPTPVYLRVAGNPEFDSEKLVGYEAGYRSTPNDQLHVDVSAFYNRHEDLETFGASSTLVETTPGPARVVLRLPYANGAAGILYGAEVGPTWKPAPWWQVRGYYAYLRIELHLIAGATDAQSVATYEGSSPRHQTQVQSVMDLPHGWELDATVRHVTALPARSVAAYTTGDIRIGWRMNDRFRLSLTGLNLGDASHPEFGHDPGPTVAVRRSVALTATWAMR